MSKFSRWLQNYLIYALPFVLIAMAWSTYLEKQEGAVSGSGFLWEIFSWNLIFWFVMLLFFVFLIVFHQETREVIVRRIANIRERDEREAQITGRASRAVFVSSLSVLMLLLFFSIFTVNITKYPASEAPMGKRGELSFGLQFSLLDEPKVKSDSKGEVLFESKDLPLSKPAILLGLILWQIGQFHWFSKKLLKEGEI